MPPFPATVTARACAKINLTLDVRAPGGDGYHELDTVFAAVGLYDELTVAPSPDAGVRVEVTGSVAVPGGAENLAARAARAALEAAGCARSRGVAVRLAKRIPARAGLGGGSSDAAAALVATNRACGLGLTAGDLEALARSLGSDVPFFLTGGIARGTGRGDRIEPLPELPPLHLVIVKPPEGVPTARAYALLDEAAGRPVGGASALFAAALREGDTDRCLSLLSNDFEPAVYTAWPRIGWTADELRMAGATSVHLCGSGAAIYGLVQTAADAQAVAAMMRTRGVDAWACRTLASAESDPLASLEGGTHAAA